MKVFTSIVLITLIGLKVNGQDSMLTMGHYWTESEANIKSYEDVWVHVDDPDLFAVDIAKTLPKFLIPCITPTPVAPATAETAIDFRVTSV